MDTVQTRDFRGEPSTLQREEVRTAEFMTGGSIVEGVGGVIGVVLAILGLAGVFPGYMVCIATIGIGVALLFEGGTIAARYSRLMSEMSGSRWTSLELGGGMTVEFLGGVAGTVLGILALLGVAPMVLTPIAAIVFGAALLMGSGATSRLSALRITGHEEHDMARRVTHEAVMAASGAQVLVGLAGAVLGILALLGLAPMVLTLIAMLSLGASVLLSGAAISDRMLSILCR